MKIKYLPKKSHLPLMILIISSFLLTACQSTSTSAGIVKQAEGILKVPTGNGLPLGDIKSFQIKGTVARNKATGNFPLLQAVLPEILSRGTF